MYLQREAELEAKSRELETLRLTHRVQTLEGRVGGTEIDKAAGRYSYKEVEGDLGRQWIFC